MMMNPEVAEQIRRSREARTEALRSLELAFLRAGLASPEQRRRVREKVERLLMVSRRTTFPPEARTARLIATKLAARHRLHVEGIHEQA